MLTIDIPDLRAVDGLFAGLFIARPGIVLRHATRTIDSHELIIVRSGVLSMHENGTPFRVSAGQALLLSAGHEHGGTESYPDDLSFYWLHFTVRAGQADVLQIAQHSSPRRPQLLMEWLHRYLDDRISGAGTPATAGLIVQLLLAELAAAPDALRAADPSAHLIGRAEAWIGHHYQESISTSDVAQALDCNPDYLGRVFRRITGTSIVAAIHARRLSEARHRLITTTDDGETIARAVGFGDVVHFRRIFRRHHGCTPGDFRAQHARVYVNNG